MSLFKITTTPLTKKDMKLSLAKTIIFYANYRPGETPFFRKMGGKHQERILMSLIISGD
jgi:hypothetical protein